MSFPSVADAPFAAVHSGTPISSVFSSIYVLCVLSVLSLVAASRLISLVSRSSTPWPQNFYSRAPPLNHLLYRDTGGQTILIQRHFIVRICPGWLGKVFTFHRESLEKTVRRRISIYAIMFKNY